MHKLSLRKGGKGQKHVEMLNRRLGRASFMVCSINQFASHVFLTNSFLALLQIGCGPNYFSMGEPIAKQIAHQIKDGTIGALTEENFGLWFIWRKELKAR